MDGGKFIKGMATGMVMGAAVSMAMSPNYQKQYHKLAKKTEGVFKSIGGVIDTAVDMWKS